MNSEQPFIFESGAVAKHLPGAIHVCFLGSDQYKTCKQPDYILKMQSPELASFLDSIQFSDNKFTIYANT